MGKNNKHGLSIESLAIYALRKIRPVMSLDFSKMVKRIDGPANFLLLVPDSRGKLNRVYLVTASPDSIKRTDQPFQTGILGYFRKFKTEPDENYYILKVQLDKNQKVHRSKAYAMPNAFRQN